MLNFEYFDATGDTVAEGVFLPVSDLIGIEASDLAAADATKSSKVLLSIYQSIYQHLTTLTVQPLGLLMTEAGLDSLTETYSLTVTYVGNHSSDTKGMVPVGSGGTIITIDDVFPNAAKLAAVASTGGAGVLIPTAELASYSGLVHADITVDADSRRWFSALSFYLAHRSDLRSDVVPSAVVSKTVGAASPFFPPTEWFSGTSPNTSIEEDDVVFHSFTTRTFENTIELVKDHDNKTFEVNHVVAA